MGLAMNDGRAQTTSAHASAPAVGSHSWLNKRQRIYWYDQYALNEQETAFSKYDPDRIAAELKATGADIVAVYAANQFSVAYYPTYTWDRLQYFLPYPGQTGTHMKELFADGGRSVMYYQGPPNNPGAEINIAFGGQLMCNPGKSIEENLAVVLERLYKPKSLAALDKLTALVLAAEDAYFGNMDWDEQHVYLKGSKLFPGPGELHLSRPITGLYGTPDFVLEPQMTFEGRKAYNAGLEAALKDAYSIGDQFEVPEKVARLQTALLNTLMMVRAVIRTQQWEEQQAKNKKI